MKPGPLLRALLGRLFQVVLFFAALVPMLLEGGGVALPAAWVPWIRLGNVAFAGFLAWEEIRRLRAAARPMEHLREEAVDYGLLAAVLLLVLEELATGGGIFGLRGEAALVGPAKGYILANLILRVVRLFRFIVRARVSYPKVFVLSFLTVVLCGTIVLWAFPGAVRPGRQISFTDAVFTSVSATCVTGLTVLNTGADFSRFGQVVILILIQIGGLGLMTFAAFFAMALGKGIGFTDRLILRDMMNVDPLNTLGRLLAGIIGITVLAEGIGAVSMFGRFPDPADPGHLLPAGEQAFYAVFHSVSAFCNAGFTLYDGVNWTPFVSDGVMSGVVIAEIVLGGLGFTVILNLMGLSRRVTDRLRRRLRRRPLTEEEEEEEERREPARVSLQTKIVLRWTLVLVGGGGVLFWLFERTGVLASFDGRTTVLASLFQSVTTRTAGFNTIPIENLHPATLFLFILLMFIGASPGGTGGGIKTVTAAVMMRSIASLAAGRKRVEFLRRTLPPEVSAQAIVVTTVASLAVFLGTLLLTLTEGGGARISGDPHDFPFLSLLFEAVSAFATVGLSTGITPSLSDAGRWVLVLLMFLGRVGPISLTLAVGERRPPALEFPEERVMIG